MREERAGEREIDGAVPRRENDLHAFYLALGIVASGINVDPVKLEPISRARQDTFVAPVNAWFNNVEANIFFNVRMVHEPASFLAAPTSDVEHGRTILEESAQDAMPGVGDVQVARDRRRADGVSHSGPCDRRDDLRDESTPGYERLIGPETTLLEPGNARVPLSVPRSRFRAERGLANPGPVPRIPESALASTETGAADLWTPCRPSTAWKAWDRVIPSQHERYSACWASFPLDRTAG